MSEQHRTVAPHAASRGNELVAEVIAGPETAARLGVPVGTVIDARHVRIDPEGIQITRPGDDIVSPAKAAAVKASWAADTAPEEE